MALLDAYGQAVVHGPLEWTDEGTERSTPVHGLRLSSFRSSSF